MARSLPHPRQLSRSLFTFLVLVFALSTPFWAIGAVTERALSSDLPISSFIWVCPVLAAALLVYRETGIAGLTAILSRSFDYPRIRAKVWYVPTVLLLPGVEAMTFAVMRLTGLPLPAVHVPVLAGLGWLAGFFIAATCEELGWSGYALDRLQARWTAFAASILLGVVWALFHYVPLLQHGRSAGWIAWWTLSTVALRVLLVWLYNNTGQSVFATAVCHATGNLAQIGPFLDFGPGGYPEDAQRISALLLTAVAAMVIVDWGPRTLSRSKFAGAGRPFGTGCLPEQ